jgi:hypothetical protein
MSVVTGEVLVKWCGISGTQVTSFARRGVVHGGDKTGHWSVGDVLMRAV